MPSPNPSKSLPFVTRLRSVHRKYGSNERKTWTLSSRRRYPVILSIENHCSVPQQKKMAEYLREVLQDKLDLSVVISNDCKKLPSPEILKGKVLIKVRPSVATQNPNVFFKKNRSHQSFLQGKKLPANIDPDAEEGDVSDEDTGDEEEEEAEDDDQQAS